MILALVRYFKNCIIDAQYNLFYNHFKETIRMVQNIAGSILYIMWLLLPLIVLGVLSYRRVPRSMRVRGTLGAAVVAMPAYLGVICLVSGMAWPPDIFFRQNSAPVHVSVANYRVGYGQQWGLDFYETYYEVEREDGLKAYLEIDGDDNKCWNITTRTVGARVYFLCDEQAISAQTSYVDTEQQFLYVGGSGCLRRLDELAFRVYAGNPLVQREQSGGNELYCQ
jgi:hypothetical protein